MTYKKPEVVSKGYTPEPVEAGCCLRSCGGSPAVGAHNSEQLTKAAEKTMQVLDAAEIETTTDH